MADKQTYTFSNDITTVEVSSLGAKIVVIPQDARISTLSTTTRRIHRNSARCFPERR